MQTSSGFDFMRMRHKQRLFTPLMTGLALIISACGAAPSGVESSGSTASCQGRAFAEIGGPISLTDHTGKAVTEADFSDNASLVFFGFTYCPDVCPFTMSKIGSAIDQLSEDTTPPRTILISVDPERDTPEQLATYISSERFPDDVVGLTGSDESIAAAAKAFLASYSRVVDESSAAGYTMDHTSLLYLMDKDWTLKTFFSFDTAPAEMANCMDELLN